MNVTSSFLFQLLEKIINGITASKNTEDRRFYPQPASWEARITKIMKSLHFCATPLRHHLHIEMGGELNEGGTEVACSAGGAYCTLYKH